MRIRCTRAPQAATAALVVLLAGVTACTADTPTAPRTAASTATATGSPTATAATPAPTEVIDTDLSPADLEAFIGNELRFTGDGDFGLDLAELVATPDAPGGTALRVTYPAGSASRSAGGPDGGMQAYLELPGGPVDTLNLEYQVRFPPDFDFVKGGKLPGLYGGSVTGGRVIPDGTDGFSTRYMWRAGGEGEVYAYLPTSQDQGTSLGRGCWSFTPGSWTSIRQRVVLNDPARADGSVTVWQDGTQVFESTGLQFRTTGDLRIEGLFFSTFFGGSDSTWATPVDQYADFAGFAVSDASDPVPAAPATVPAGCGAMSTQ